MANIIDYIKWRGDLTLEQSKFNEVDNLILSRFSYLPFDKIIKEDVILENRVIPFSLVKENQIEVRTKSSINTVEEARGEAISLGVDKMQNKLNNNEYIIKYKVIKEHVEQDGVRLNIFFSVCEDITKYVEIKEEKNE